MTFQEICVSAIFFVLIFLWFCRSPGFFTGWSDALGGPGKLINAELKSLILLSGAGSLSIVTYPYITGAARLFCSRAEFGKKILPRASFLTYF